MSRRLPLEPVSPGALPPVTSRSAWQAELDSLLVREKAHTRAGDELAAAREGRLSLRDLLSDVSRGLESDPGLRRICREITGQPEVWATGPLGSGTRYLAGRTVS